MRDPRLFAQGERLVFEVEDEFGPIVFAHFEDARAHMQSAAIDCKLLARFSETGERVRGIFYTEGAH